MHMHTYYLIWLLNVLCNTEFGSGKKLEEGDLTEIIPSIAVYWKDVGIQLGIRNVEIYSGDPESITDEKFNKMLLEWLQKNKKSLGDLGKVFGGALRVIQLNAAAEKFHDNCEQFKKEHEPQA